MLSWLSSLFGGKKKRSYTKLSKFDVARVEEMIDNYHRGIVCEYFRISKTTYYKIKNKKHKYSKKD